MANRERTHRCLIVTILAALLAGCGGGGEQPELVAGLALNVLLTPPPEPCYEGAPLAFEFVLSGDTDTVEESAEPRRFSICLDGVELGDLSSPFRMGGLPAGTHRFEVSAAGAESVVHEWEVLPAVETVIESVVVPGGGVILELSSNYADAAFWASLDGAVREEVGNPLDLKHLAPGHHHIEIIAVRHDTTEDLSPAVMDWDVEVAQDTTIVEQPVPEGRDTTARFLFEAAVPESSFDVSFDGSDFVAADAEFVVNGLAVGPHVLLVRASSPTGAVDATPAEYRWSIVLPDPVVAVTFPPQNAAVEEPSICVHGAVRGIVDPIASVTVNGVAAESADGFETFSVVLDLEPGTTDLDIVCRDTTGRVVEESGPKVTYEGPLLLFPLALALYGDNRALVVDSGRGAVVEVDFATGMRRIVSGPGKGQGPAIPQIQTAALDAENHKYYILDGRNVIEVDLKTAERRFVFESDGDMGALAVGPGGDTLFLWKGKHDDQAILELTLDDGAVRTVSDGSDPGPGLHSFRFMSYDARRCELVALRNCGPGPVAVLAVNVKTGVRRVVSDPDTGTGTALPAGAVFFVGGMAYDAAGDRVMMFDRSCNSLYTVDLKTGNRARKLAGGPLWFIGATDLVYDAENDRAIFVDRISDGVCAFDMDDAGMTLLSGTSVGEGPQFRGYDGIVDTANAPVLGQTVAIVGHHAGWQASMICGIDHATGKRNLISGNGRGSGPGFGNVEAITYSEDRDRIFVLDEMASSLLSIDPATGNRETVVSDPAGRPAGWYEMVLDAGRDRVLVASYKDGLRAIDLETGALTTLIAAENLPKNSHRRPTDMAVDPQTGFVFTVRSGERSVYRLDPATGTGEVYASWEPGRSLLFQRKEYAARAVRVDTANGRLLVLTNGGMLAVDLKNRAVSVVFDEATGGGMLPHMLTTISLDSEHGLVFVGSNGGGAGLRALLAIDLTTGDRVIAAR